MKLYLLTRIDEIDWDEYVGAVIAAPTEEIAREIMLHIALDGIWKCDLISETATDQVEQGVVLYSYNTG